jgi:GntR family transcriptional regulator
MYYNVLKDMIPANPGARLDKSSMVPLYSQIAEAIEQAIYDGSYSPGSKIPSERELSETYRVSRVTVRLAMKYLLGKNLIVRRKGMGTFVRKRMITQTLEELWGFYPSLLHKGLKPRIRILEYRIVPPEPEVKEGLQLGPGEKVLRLIREYFLEKNVLAVIVMNIPSDLAERWTEKEAGVKNSFRLLDEHAGVRIGNATVKIRASQASRRIGEMLQIRKGNPVLELRRLTFSAEGKPVEYALLYFPGDFYELTAQLQAGDWREVRLGGK